MGMDGLVALCAALGIDPESDVRLLRGARVESYPLTAFQTTTPACRRRKNHLKRTSSPCRVRSRPQVPLLAPQGQEARAVIEGGVVRGPRAPAPRLDREAKGLCARARPREPRQAVVPRFFQVRVPLLARRGVWIEALSRRSFFRARRGSRTFAAGVGLQRGSRHRRGCHADLPCRQVAATPRLPRGSSEGTTRARALERRGQRMGSARVDSAAATTWVVRGSGSSPKFHPRRRRDSSARNIRVAAAASPRPATLGRSTWHPRRCREPLCKATPAPRTIRAASAAGPRPRSD